MNKNLKDMTQAELRQYMLQNRNNDEKMRAAIAESTSRPGWTKVPANADVEQILGQSLSKERK